jgi:nucleotide-binding universal stress UspA family protein
MMAADNPRIRRILVALDASGSSLSALQNAVELAARLESELIGLFVEDINLLRVTQLPFVREISYYSTALRPLQSVELERQLRAQAQQMRRIMARLAEHRGVSWRLRVERGSVAAEVLAAGADADLMVLGKIGRSFSGLQRTGSTVRMLMTRRAGLTLIMQSGGGLSLPVVVLFDGSECAFKGLEAAGHLVHAQDGRLTIFVIADDKNQARKLQEDVMQRLQLHELGADFRLLIQPSLTGLAQLIRMESSGPVVVPCEKMPLEGEQLCALVDELANPVLLVR